MSNRGLAIGPRRTLHNLRWLPEGAQERAAHALTVPKPGLASNDIHRVLAGSHHQLCSFDA